MAHPKRSVFHRERKLKESQQPVIEARAIARYTRISPRKARAVINAIKGKKVEEAFKVLELSPKKAARLIYKVLKSAVSNAENNFGLDVDSLYVKKCYVNDGPRLKRIWRRGRGRADIIQRRLSHIGIVVCDASKEETLMKENNESSE